MGGVILSCGLNSSKEVKPQLKIVDITAGLQPADKHKMSRKSNNPFTNPVGEHLHHLRPNFWFMDFQGTNY